MYYYENYEFLTKGREVVLFVNEEEGKQLGVIKKVMYHSSTKTYGDCVVKLRDGRVFTREFEDVEALFTDKEVITLDEMDHAVEIEPNLSVLETADMDGSYL